LAGPEDDFELFYKSAFQRVFSFALLMCGDVADAEDATQEAFAAAFRQWDSWAAGDGTSRLAYVFGAARKQVITAFRGRERRGMLREKLGQKHSGKFVHVEEEAMRSYAVRAMMRLPQQQRAVAILHWVEEMPVAEVADILGVSPKTVITHRNRARARLSPQLDDAWDPRTEGGTG
jgi:RNA polymerase sigma-70 factor (ECF subfamily)